MISNKGTTGCTVVKTKDEVQVILISSGEVVWSLPKEKAPDYNGDELFDWVMENYSEEISKAIDGK